jgi:ring-1,2-phenylacetyl-CoA epoxidase subunit PaaC
MKDFLPKEQYILQYADNVLILGHRLAEWCGHGPVLEQDIALTNIALDLVGMARNFYQYAAEIGKKESEDFYPYLREERFFYNAQLVELPNQDFGYTIVRQFLFDTFHFQFLSELSKSKDTQLRAISVKSIKEVSYHQEFSYDWLLRLGDGTEESHRRVQKALDDYFPYALELLEMTEIDNQMLEKGIGVDLQIIAPKVKEIWTERIKSATLLVPQSKYWMSGGKKGKHTEHMGRILTEMQYLQRAYPGAQW